MASEQVIVTTIFGSQAETLEKTFGSFLKVPNAQLHAFVYNPDLPQHRHPKIEYHLVKPDPDFVSVRRDALFRRWTLPDQLGVRYALVADGIDVVCLHPLPPFEKVLRGASVAAASEWVSPVRIPGQGFVASYLNAGITFWDLENSRDIRQEIELRGRTSYRGPFDDQTALNEVVFTKYFDRLVILPPHYNWRALYRRSVRSWRLYFRSWPRVDSLDGVRLYHNQNCVDQVLADSAARPPAHTAELPKLSQDVRPLTPLHMLWRRVKHRLLHS